MELAPSALSSVNWPCVARPRRAALAEVLDVGVEAQLLGGARLGGRTGACRRHKGACGRHDDDSNPSEQLSRTQEPCALREGAPTKRYGAFNVAPLARRVQRRQRSFTAVTCRLESPQRRTRRAHWPSLSLRHGIAGASVRLVNVEWSGEVFGRSDSATPVILLANSVHTSRSRRVALVRRVGVMAAAPTGCLRNPTLADVCAATRTGDRTHEQ